MKQNKLSQLIAASKGKFFSISFVRVDSTRRTINGKDKYFRLIKGNPTAATEALAAAGYVPVVDRNKESWANVHPTRALRFKCGDIDETF
jgi:phage/plasmid primase-like uncharacterized protein